MAALDTCAELLSTPDEVEDVGDGVPTMSGAMDTQVRVMIGEEAVLNLS